MVINMYQKGLNILKTLEENGYEGYIIGGFPRDKYLNIISYDIDICTNAKPSDILKIFPEAITTNIKYGNIIIDNVQITTYRKEKYDKNRYPKVKYVDDLKIDLLRRDFIINTLCIDSNGNYLDIYNAKEDLDKKIIRTVGDPYQKLQEDPLRILRAIRFASTLDFSLDDELSNAIKKYGYLVEKLSYAKKKSELIKIINHKKGIELILKYKLDHYLNIYNLDKIDDNEDILSQIDINNKYL